LIEGITSKAYKPWLHALGLLTGNSPNRVTPLGEALFFSDNLQSHLNPQLFWFCGDGCVRSRFDEVPGIAYCLQ